MLAKGRGRGDFSGTIPTPSLPQIDVQNVCNVKRVKKLKLVFIGLLFIIVELARGGRKVSQKIENVAHVAGFLLLMGLILVMSFVDIRRIVSGESLF